MVLSHDRSFHEKIRANITYSVNTWKAINSLFLLVNFNQLVINLDSLSNSSSVLPRNMNTASKHYCGDLKIQNSSIKEIMIKALAIIYQNCTKLLYLNKIYKSKIVISEIFCLKKFVSLIVKYTSRLFQLLR